MVATAFCPSGVAARRFHDFVAPKSSMKSSVSKDQSDMIDDDTEIESKACDNLDFLIAVYEGERTGSRENSQKFSSSLALKNLVKKPRCCFSVSCSSRRRKFERILTRCDWVRLFCCSDCLLAVHFLVVVAEALYADDHSAVRPLLPLLLIVSGGYSRSTPPPAMGPPRWQESSCLSSNRQPGAVFRLRFLLPAKAHPVQPP